MTKQPTVLLADDHSLLLDGVRRLLAPEYDVVGTVSDGRELLKEAERVKPELIVVDVGMPYLNGIEATRQVRRRAPESKVVILSQHSGKDYVREALQAGASGYVLKQSLAWELAPALRAALEGRSYVSQSLAESMATSETQPLTPRQLEILRIAGQGKTSAEIAEALDISVKTVEFHLGTMMSELGLKTLAELRKYALSRRRSSEDAQ